jgi:O-antigen/teichoic acid export membrane protein
MSTTTSPPAASPEGHRQLAARAARGGLVLLAARLAMQGFVWGVTLTVARLLEPRDYGVLTAGTIFLVLADLLAEAGLGRALIQAEDLRPDDLASAFTLSLLLAAVLYAALFAAAPALAGFLAMPEVSGLLRVMGLLVLLTPFKAVPQALLDRGLRLGRQAAVHVACSAAQAALVLGLAAAGCGYWALAAGAMAGRSLEALFLAWAAGWRPRLAWAPGRARRLLSFGVQASLTSLLWFAYSNSDFAVVAKLAGAEALGYYTLAFQLISLPVQKLTANANQAAYPVFCRLQNDRPRLRAWYLRLTTPLGLVGVPVLGGMALVAEDAFALGLGERWLPAVLPFRLLAAVGVLMIYAATIPPLLNALGRPGVNLRYTALCALVYPVAFWVGAKLAGLTGVCLAWVILYPVLAGGLVVCTRRITGVGLLDLVGAQAPVLAAAAVMAGVVLGLRWLLGDAVQGPARLGLCVAAGAAAYTGVVLALAGRTVLADVRAVLRPSARTPGEG